MVAFTSQQSCKMFDTDQAGVVISTYCMVAFKGSRSADVQRKIEAIMKIDWGLLILDEV